MRVTGHAMTIDYTVQVVGKESQRPLIEEVIFETFLEIDALYNKWNPSSQLSLFNEGLEGDFSQLLPFLKEVDKYVILTEGRFDPTVETIQKVWKDKSTPPNIDAIAKARQATGWDHITLESGLKKDHPLTALDLGGVAKGFAVDLIADTLKAKGFAHGLVEWGGELKGWGRHPEKRPWIIFITAFGDTNPEKAIDTLYLEDAAIATSGDYHQNFRLGDDLFTHIFSVKEGGPLKVSHRSIASVSVKAKRCALADAVATAAMLEKGEHEALLFLERVKAEVPEMEYWIVTH